MSLGLNFELWQYYYKYGDSLYISSMTYKKSHRTMICTPFTGCPVKGVHIIKPVAFTFLGISDRR